MHGKGVYTWADGRKYEGDYLNDRKHGFGSYVWADGRQYVGEWLNGKQHGEGKYKQANGQGFKTGVWQDGKRVQWLE